MTDSSPLIPPSELAQRAGRWRLLDASWLYPPLNAAGIDVRRRYAEAHPAGAAFLDLAALGPSPAADVPALTPPAPATLRVSLAPLGIAPDTPLVVTDMDGGTTTAPFARLALLDAGFDEVRLLDGGTPAWRAAGLPLTDEDPVFVGVVEAPPATGRGMFIGTDATLSALDGRTARVIDARFVASNVGVLPERFADVAIPADVVLRAGEVVAETAAGQRFAPAPAIRRLALERGLDDAMPAIATCHFGLAAAAVATALEIAGLPRPQVDAASLVGWAEVQAPSG